MSSNKTEKDNKERQERYQAILSALLRDDDNKYCVDCDAKGPRWASWNLGIFMCIRCAGIHRNLGVHISKVKSVTLDTWTPEQIAMVQEMGNSRARAVYEANLPDNFRRPQTDSALEAFIRAKYEQKKYIASEWVPPKPRALPLAIEEPIREKKVRPRASHNSHLGTVGTRTESAGVPPPVQAESRGIKVGSAGVKVDSRGVKAVEVAPTQTREPEVDLLGLETPIPAAATGSTSSSDDLFSAFCSAPPPAAGGGVGEVGGAGALGNGLQGSLGAELSGDMALFGNGAEQKQASSKDAIMALYGPTTGHSTNSYGGMFGGTANQMMPMMANQQVNGMIGMMPNNVQMQQMMAGGMQPQQAAMMGMPAGMGMQAGIGGGLMFSQGGVPGHVMMGQSSMYGMQQQQHPPAMYGIQQVQNQMSSMSLMQEQNGGVPPGQIGYWPSPHMMAPSVAGGAPPAGTGQP